MNAQHRAMDPQVRETFEHHGVKLEDNMDPRAALPPKLAKLRFDELRNLAEEFLTKRLPDIEGDERSQKLTVTTALIDFIESGKKKIYPKDLYNSFRHAQTNLALIDSGIFSGVGETRSVTLFPLVKEIVRQNPSVSKSEFIKIANATIPNVAANTLTMYFYRAHKELDVPTRGVKGRRPGSAFDKVKKAIMRQPHAPAETMVPELSEELNLTEGTVKSYYYKAHREIRSTH